MAIKLEIQPYCENCTIFDADVERPRKLYKTGATVIDPYEVFQTDTIVRCEYRNTCTGLMRYLEKERQKGEQQCLKSLKPKCSAGRLRSVE